MTKNCNCVWCGKAPKRDYIMQRQKAVSDGEYDWEAYKEHTNQRGQYGEVFKMPTKKQWDQFMITHPVFPNWEETNYTVVKEIRHLVNLRERVVWDGESYKPHKVDGLFCTNKCAIEFAVAIAKQGVRWR